MSPQDKAVLDCIYRGLSDKEIAQELGVSVSTVKYHNKRIFRKLKVSSRCEVMAKRIDSLELAVEPLANMFMAANMNDPISKWLTIGQLQEAEDVLRK